MDAKLPVGFIGKILLRAKIKERKKMDVENMKKILDEAFERERRKQLKEEQKEAFKESKLAYIGGIILLVIIGLMIVGFMIATVIVVGRTIEDKNKAPQYDLNCLTEPVEKPLTECKK